MILWGGFYGFAEWDSFVKSNLFHPASCCDHPTEQFIIPILKIFAVLPRQGALKAILRLITGGYYPKSLHFISKYIKLHHLKGSLSSWIVHLKNLFASLLINDLIGTTVKYCHVIVIKNSYTSSFLVFNSWLNDRDRSTSHKIVSILLKGWLMLLVWQLVGEHELNFFATLVRESAFELLIIILKINLYFFITRHRLSQVNRLSFRCRDFYYCFCVLYMMLKLAI